MQKTNQEKFRIEKAFKRKINSLYIKWKGYDNPLNICINEKYFPKPFKSFGENINVKVDLSNYATKTDLENVTHVDTSSFPLQTNLAGLKTEVDKLGIGKIAPVPVGLNN